MASQRVHGITIDLDVNTSGVSQSFSKINKDLSATQRELNAVNKLLKDDAENTTLLSQKQSLLSDAIEKTSAKLKILNEAKAKADKNTNKTEQEAKEYRELERDILNTTRKLEEYQSQQEETVRTSKDLAGGTKDIGNAMDEASQRAINLGDIIKANIISDIIMDGIKELANVVKEFVGQLSEWAESYREMEVYEAQFESNIRNTADATDEEIKKLKELAKQKERQGVVSSKAITSAYQELATYVESTDAIEGLTDALVDMSAQQYGIDASEESVRNLATTLGKALANGDYSGLTRLGYGFDEAQQRIMKYGNELQRVAVLNDVIESSIGGMNEALAQTDAGVMFQASSYFDDVKQTIGEIISELEVNFVEGVFPSLQVLMDGVITWFDENKDEFLEFIQSIVEWLTSDEAMEWFEKMGQMVDDLWETISALKDIIIQTGIVEGAVWALGKAIEFVRDLVVAIRDTLAEIKDKGLFNWAIGNYNSYDWGSGGDSFTPGWSGGFGALNSGGFASGGLTLNATFTVNSNNITRSDVQSWASWLADDINNELGRRIR